MSLMRIALRMACVEAIRGNTFAGNNVLDSEMGAIDIAVDGTVDSERSAPFISIYTAEANGSDKGRLSLFGRMKTELVFDMAISAQMQRRDDEGNLVIGDLPVTPMSDRAYEVSIDVLQHEIIAALGSPKNEWAEIARQILTDNIEAIEISVGRSSSKTRLAARQIRITVDLPAGPTNLPLSENHAFSMFLNKLDEGDEDEYRDEDFKGLATALRGVLTNDHAGWELDQFRYGMSETELDNLRLTNLADTTISEVEIEVGLAS